MSFTIYCDHIVKLVSSNCIQLRLLTNEFTIKANYIDFFLFSVHIFVKYITSHKLRPMALTVTVIMSFTYLCTIIAYFRDGERLPLFRVMQIQTSIILHWLFYNCLIKYW